MGLLISEGLFILYYQIETSELLTSFSTQSQHALRHTAGPVLLQLT